MTPRRRTQLESELTRLQDKRIAINAKPYAKPYAGELGGYRAKQLQALERREAEIYSELDGVAA